MLSWARFLRALAARAELLDTLHAAQTPNGRYRTLLAFDLIVEADGTPYAIECNPRASSNITSFYNHPGLGAVLVQREAQRSRVQMVEMNAD